jgi:hypothetical protein
VARSLAVAKREQVQTADAHAVGISARRVRLLNAMVCTHMPSNALLALIALMPPVSLATLMLRLKLSQVDVSAR